MEIHGSSPADGVRRHLNRAQGKLEGTLSKLGSGMRIAKAADDASGLSMSERMRAMIDSFDAANRNVADGMNLVQTAEGALTEAGEITSRMRELAVQGANGTLSDSDRASLQGELEAMRAEFDAVTGSAKFNGAPLFDGSSAEVTVQAGSAADDTIDIELQSMSAADLGLETISLSTAEEASSALASIDASRETVSNVRGRFGAVGNQLSNVARTIDEARASMMRTESGIRDADLAVEMANRTQQDLLARGSVAMLSQANVSSARAQQLLSG